MYFHLNKYVYLTYFNSEIIVLNLLRDQYIILPEGVANVVFLALNNKFDQEHGRYILVDNKNFLPKYFDEIIKSLQDNDIFSNETFDYPTVRLLKKGRPSAGESNIDWRMLNNDLDAKVPSKVIIEAYFLLIKVYFLLKIFGFYNLIESIKRHSRELYVDKDCKDFLNLAVALNKACFYFPVRVKCLEWAAALTFMGLKRKWKCNIEIGVQNLPFASHAWVTVNGEVLADNPSLPEKLSVILSEPFVDGVLT